MHFSVQAIAAAWEEYNRQVAEWNAYQAQLQAQSSTAESGPPSADTADEGQRA